MAQKLNSEVKAAWLNGEPMPIVDGSASINFGGKERTEKLGSNRVLGYAEANVAAKFTGSIVWVRDQKLRATFDADGDAEIRVVTSQDQELVMRDVALATPLEWGAGEGDVSFDYTGSQVEEVD